MNAWKSIIMVGAAFAVAAPAASASLERMLPTKAPHAKAAKANVVAKTHKPMARVAVTQPLYIYYPGPSVAPSTDAVADTTTVDAGAEDDCN